MKTDKKIKMAGQSIMIERLTKIDENVSHLCDDSKEINIKVARIEEHLKGINGNLNRHENEIKNLYEKQEKTSLRVAKYMGAGGFGGIIAGIILSMIKGG